MRAAYHYGISGACAAVIVVFAAVPETVWASLPLVCVFRTVLDLECFGCGMTRALAAMMHGRLEAALALNQGVTVLVGGLAAGMLAGVRR